MWTNFWNTHYNWTGRVKTASLLELQYDISCYSNEYPPWKLEFDKGKDTVVPVYAMMVMWKWKHGSTHI